MTAAMLHQNPHAINMMPQALHPRTGDLPRPGSGGYGAGSLAPLSAPPGPSKPLLSVQSLIDGLDAEVAAVAKRKEEEKTWKASFQKDKQAMAQRLAEMGMKGKDAADYAKGEEERQEREKRRFREEKEAMQRRLNLMGSIDAALADARRQQPAAHGQTPPQRAAARAERGPPSTDGAAAASAVASLALATAAAAAASASMQAPAGGTSGAVPRAASVPPGATGGSDEGAVAAQSALSAGRKARDEWEAAKLRVKRLEQELEEGKKQRGKTRKSQATAQSTLGGVSPMLQLGEAAPAGAEHSPPEQEPNAPAQAGGDGAREAESATVDGAVAADDPAEAVAESFAAQFASQYAKEKEDAARKAQARREALQRQREEDAAERVQAAEERQRIAAAAEEEKLKLEEARSVREEEESARLVAAAAKAEEARRRAAERGAELARIESAKQEAARAEVARVAATEAEESRRAAEAAAEAEYQAKFQAMLAEAAQETESVVALAAKRQSAAVGAVETATGTVSDTSAAATRQSAMERVESVWAEAEAEIFSTAGDRETERDRERRRDSERQRDRESMQATREEILMKDVERRARANGGHADQSQERSARWLEHGRTQPQTQEQRQREKPVFTAGYEARVRAQMASDTRFREDVVQWDKRRNEIETGLAQTKQDTAVLPKHIAEYRAELLGAWLELMRNQVMLEAVCTLWENPQKLSAAWDAHCTEYRQYTISKDGWSSDGWSARARTPPEQTLGPGLDSGSDDSTTRDEASGSVDRRSFERMIGVLESGLSSADAPPKPGAPGGANVPFVYVPPTSAISSPLPKLPTVQEQQEQEHLFSRAYATGADAPAPASSSVQSAAEAVATKREQIAAAVISKREAIEAAALANKQAMEMAARRDAALKAEKERQLKEAREVERVAELAKARKAAAERRIQEIWEAEERKVEESYSRSRSESQSTASASASETTTADRTEATRTPPRQKRQQQSATEQKSTDPPKRTTPQPAADAVPPSWHSSASAFDDGIRVSSVVTTEERKVAQAEKVKVQQAQRVKDLRQGEAARSDQAAKKQALVARIEADLQRKVGGKSFAEALRSFGVDVPQYATAEQLQKAKKKALVKFHPDRATQRGASWEEVVQAEEIYKLLQNLSSTASATHSAGQHGAAAQYQYRKEQHAAANASAGEQARRRMHEAREHQQAREAASRMKEQMDRMERKRTEAERKSHAQGGGGPPNQHSALKTLAVLAAERELRELHVRYGLHLQSREGLRIKQLLIQRAMVSGTEWNANGEKELAGLLYDCKLGLTGQAPGASKADQAAKQQKQKKPDEKKAWNLLRKFGSKKK